MHESFSPDGSEVLAIGTCDEIFAGRRFRDLPRTRALGEEHSEVLKKHLSRILRFNAGLPVDRESAFLREMRDDDLTDLAAQIARKGERSLTTSDFADAFSTSLSEILVENYVIDDQLAAACGDLTIPDFKQTRITELQMPPLSDEPEPEDGPVVFAKPVLSSATTGQVRTYSTRMKFSRQLWSTNGREITRAIANYGRELRRLEMRLLAETITANPTVDGEPLFTYQQNWGGAVAFSESTLGDSIEYLAQFQIGGDYSALTPGAVLCGAAARATIGSVLRDCGMETLPVVCLPWLGTGEWIVVPSPNHHVVLARLTIENGSSKPYVGWLRGGQSVGYAVFHDVGFTVMSRAAYRGGVAP